MRGLSKPRIASQELYNFKDWQFSVAVTIDEVPYMDFLIPEEVSQILIKSMKEHGMIGRILNEVINEFKNKLFNAEFPNADSIIDKFKGWTFIRFTPMSQKNCRNIVRNNSKYLYHITEPESVEKIMQTGFTPKNLSHPEVQPRIFMISGSRSDLQQNYGASFDINTYIDSLARKICQYRTGTPYQKNWKYALITIDIDCIPEDVPLYWDIYSFPFAVFTESNIPADAIVKYKIMNLR